MEKEAPQALNELKPKNITSSTPQDTNITLSKATDATLQFLSTASNETLGGIAVGLTACTYLILGQLGLLIIGIFVGVLLHATWEKSSHAGNPEEARREKGVDIVKRLIDSRSSETSLSAVDDSEDTLAKLNVGFEDFRPETKGALNALVDAVIKDYVKWWYEPILPGEESFPAASRRTLTGFLRNISNHLVRKRPADTFLDFLTNASAIIIVFFGELSSALSTSQGSTSAPEAVHDYLVQYPESNLANILNVTQQKRKFKLFAGDILDNFLDKAAYNCEPSRVFLKEVLAGLVMETTLATCSKPEWLNGWIVYLLEEGEPDISQAIDIGIGSLPEADTDGNPSNVGLVKAKRAEVKKHQKRLSKAEEAMEEAMEEAKRLSQLIAEEENKKKQNASGTPNGETTKTPISEFAPKHEERYDPPRNQEEAAPMKNNVDAHTPTAPVRPSSSTPSKALGSSFTSFDQLVPPSQPSPLQEEPPAPVRRATVSLTLHNAHITLHDDSSSSDKGRIRTKPTGDYWVQIEPDSSQHPGWMIVRRYADFETLHEVLKRIASISGVRAFAEQHGELPSWKTHTKPSLRGELERYLRDACWHQQLAESEGMKRFLEKDQAQNASGGKNFGGLGWPSPAAFETMGKGMLDALTSAPKGAAEGGKAVFGGVSGVLGNIGSLAQKKRESTTSLGHSSTMSVSTIETTPVLSGTRKGRASEDSLRLSPIVQTQPSKIPPMERRPSYVSVCELSVDNDGPGKPRNSTSARSARSARSSASNSRDPSQAPSIIPRTGSVSHLNGMVALPPPPSDISDDYGTQSEGLDRSDSYPATPRTSMSNAPSIASPTRNSLSSNRPQLPPLKEVKRIRPDAIPLSEAETRVAVELLFAVINELYTLSSAWNIRRTLLTAAKTFLLRPGNPSLTSIQSLIQDSVIASNTSDAGIASHLRKIRENAVPTEEELKAWPAEMTSEEKEKLRVKARKLLVERGVPVALMGVMGQAATGEAMGKLFDCLQDAHIARGLMFGLLLQAGRAMAD